MIIRDAKYDDFEKVMPLAHIIHANSPPPFSDRPINEATIQRIFVVSIAFEDGFAKVVEHDGEIVGVMVGVVAENHWGLRAAMDYFTFSQGGTRKLIQEFKAFARSRNADFTQITDLCGEPKYHQMLESEGLKPIGINFIGAV